MKTLCIIPARGGSKGLKDKNIMDLCGKPLMGYSIEAALAAKSVDKVVVSTDSEKIANVVRDFCDVEIIMRPAQFAQDDSPIEDALLHTVKYLKESQNYEPGIVVWIQPNVPIRETGAIDRVVDALANSDADSCVTCYEVDQLPEWMKKINDQGMLESCFGESTAVRRQEVPQRYLLDGAIVAMRTENLIKCEGVRKPHACLGKNIIPIIQTDKKYSTEIDVFEDFQLVQYYMQTN